MINKLTHDKITTVILLQHTRQCPLFQLRRRQVPLLHKITAFILLTKSEITAVILLTKPNERNFGGESTQKRRQKYLNSNSALIQCNVTHIYPVF